MPRAFSYILETHANSTRVLSGRLKRSVREGETDPALAQVRLDELFVERLPISEIRVEDFILAGEERRPRRRDLVDLLR
jgi:hypothetical protein